MLTPRQLAAEMAPKLQSLAEESREVVVGRIVQGGGPRLLVQWAWPTLIGEIENALEALLQLMSDELSGLSLAGFAHRLQEIERDTAQYVASISGHAQTILQQMRPQFIEDAGGMARRLAMRVLWGPLMQRVPDGILAAINHVVAAIRSHPIDDILRMFATAKAESQRMF